MRKASLFLVLILTATALLGCNNTQPPIEPPVVQDDEINMSSEYEQNVSMYFVQSGSLGLIVDSVPFTNNIDEAISQSVMEHLFSNDLPSRARELFYGQAELLDVIISNGVALVFIKVPTDYMTNLNLFNAVISITNTLCGLEEVDSVSLNINGDPLAPQGLLTNPMYPTDEDLQSMWLVHNQYNLMQNDLNPGLENEYILYFSDLSTNHLVAEVRTAAFESDNALKNVLDELFRGPNDGYLKKPLTNDFILEDQDVRLDVSLNQQLAYIYFTNESYSTMDIAAREILFGSIVLSVMAQVPDIEGVRIFVNNKPLSRISAAKNARNGVFTAELFYDMVGTFVTLYIADSSEGVLVPIKRVMSQDEYSSPRSRIIELIQDSSENETSRFDSIVSLNIDQDCITNIGIDGDCLVIDFCDGFLTSFEGDLTSEKLIIYSLVNSMVELDNINTVQILVDGEKVDCLDSGLCLLEPLFANPGINLR